MFSHGTQNLPYLVRLRLAADVLEIENLRDIGMNVDVVAASNPGKAKAKRFKMASEVAKTDVGVIAMFQLALKASWIHKTNVCHSCDTHFDSNHALGKHRGGVMSGLRGCWVRSSDLLFAMPLPVEDGFATLSSFDSC